MNAAQTYKDIIFKWKTYLWSFFFAVLFFAASALRGWYVERQAIEEEMLEEELAEELEDEVYDPTKVPYIEDFKRCAPSVGWDWELLASVAYHESRFNPHTVSPGGAQGLMQLMPVTGEKFGLNDSTFFLPADNIAAGCKYIARLQHFFKDIEDVAEQTKFVLASYNAGPAHIYDAQALARKYGADPQLWDDVEFYLGLLKQEEFYTDSVVKYGYFGGRQTIAYVRGTLRTYQEIRTGAFSMRPRSVKLTAESDSLQYPLDSLDLMEAEPEEHPAADRPDSASQHHAPTTHSAVSHTATSSSAAPSSAAAKHPTTNEH